ncbi:site-specific integrase [Pseudenhygromyxa sp. WMMC2535]|uniref:tyrosine-type recombinase/integrase n=1 Tax=Pseudenhygromyxa sp. WMMC2535 TaxID=2712867 RepID=UPI0020D06E18|nr:site-specific integrase [Pseudenhygromyxa sp. WMMC2535]
MLGPIVGDLRLDQIDVSQVQRVRSRLAGKHAHTVNKALSTLSTMLKCAILLGLIPAGSLPTIKRLKPKSSPRDFWGFDEYARLIDATATPVERVGVLLGGDAGLRWGEIRGLHWDSVDFDRGVLIVRRSLWRGVLDVPKNGKSREVPMTARLCEALEALSGQGSGPYVLCRAMVSTHRAAPEHPVGQQWLLQRLRRLCSAAKVKRRGPHTLRHTFCSHLAMRGIPARVIQELAGHASLMTTECYMHLAPGLTHAAIASLEAPPPVGLPHP